MPDSSRKKTPVDHGSKRQHIVKVLLEQIVQGKIPAATRLVTQNLEKQFKISATPIREALAELAGMGVVELLPNRGATVREFTRREIREILQVRKALECEAIRLAVGRIDRVALEQLHQNLKSFMAKAKQGKRFTKHASQLDSRLHDLIARSCGNRFLFRELERFSLLFRSFRDAAWASASKAIEKSRLLEESQEHDQIIQALLQGNRARAVKAMRQHIQSTARYWSNVRTVAEMSTSSDITP